MHESEQVAGASIRDADGDEVARDIEYGPLGGDEVAVAQLELITGWMRKNAQMSALD